MASVPPPESQRKRVKVYELKQNDWFDRGTGFCIGTWIDDEARIHVQSEDDPNRTLLETKISKDDGYQKQQDTLIVWTEPNGTDMALSFQEAEGCASIWDFVSEIQQRLGGLPPGDDGLSDEALEGMHGIPLPPPELGTLPDVENHMRMANSSAQGRDALTKFVIQADYISKLVPLVEMAEDLEDLGSLHRLCNILKTLILLNDTAIIEFVVNDDIILGVVGALEYDPDFPSHKANHRQYLSDESRFKEVVKIEEPSIKRKIHYTYRLQYLKDVVLARILDDPTFSVLNSLIFFHQVDIVQHLQGNLAFLKELFGIFQPSELNPQRKKDAVLFIQNCCAISKSLQAQARAQLYQNLINCGLFNVITFALRHQDAAVRVAGTDILVALIDHDALMIRGQIFKAINEKSKPLTDTLIELLLVEVDLGVKAQMADAIKVLLDPNANTQSVETLGRSNNEFLAKVRGSMPGPPQADNFIQSFYNDSATKLFQPLKDLEKRESMDNLSIQEVSLYSHLVEVLCFFIRQHSFRSKYFILSEGLASRVAQLMSCPEKHLKLTALKYFRTCIGLHDEFHNRQIIQHQLFDPILNIVYETMPRDNLLNSACLEMFEFIKKENVKPIIAYLVETYRDKLEQITYVDTFQNIIMKYEQQRHQAEHGLNGDANTSYSSVDTEPATMASTHGMVNGGRWQGLKDQDADEEAYFNGEDADDDEDGFAAANHGLKPMMNGASPAKPLVDYPDDDEDLIENFHGQGSLGGFEIHTENGELAKEEQDPEDRALDEELGGKQGPTPPPERLAEKRRREEDEEEDELGKLSERKRRSSGASESSVGSSSNNNNTTTTTTSNSQTGRQAAGQGAGAQQTHFLRRKKSMPTKNESTGPKRISISLASKGEKEEGGS